MDPVFRLVWTLAIVGLVAFVSRATSSSSEASAESVRCAIAPPRDLAGLEACVARFPRDVELLVQLATAYEAAGRTDDARATYRRAIAVDPRDADAQRRLDESLRR
jgi:tetratricopeptide (TPR) repeat protein